MILLKHDIWPIGHIKSNLQRECQTRATWVWHEWDTIDTSATQVRHECYTNETNATRVKNVDFDNDLCKNISTPFYLLYGKWKTSRKGTISFQELPFGNASFPCQSVFKSVPQKLNFLMAKAISECCTLDCSCNYTRYVHTVSLIFDKNHFMWKYQHSF